MITKTVLSGGVTVAGLTIVVIVVIVAIVAIVAIAIALYWWAIRAKIAAEIT